MTIRVAFLAPFLLLAGCAAYEGAGLREGVATEADVVRQMGTPAMVFEGADGARQLVFPRGPLGTQTFMAHFGPDDRLRVIEPVLNDDTFNAIRPGLAREEVLRMIGPPRDTMAFPQLGHVAWDYKYVDTWGYRAIFSVTFDRDGRVVGKISSRIERDRGI